MQHKLAHGDASAQVTLLGVVLGNCGLHGGVEKACCVASCGFSLVHGQVCLLQQIVLGLQVTQEHDDANAGGAFMVVAFELVGRGKGLQQLAGDGFGLGGCFVCVRA